MTWARKIKRSGHRLPIKKNSVYKCLHTTRLSN